MNFASYSAKIKEFETKIAEVVNGRRGYVLASDFNGIGVEMLDRIALDAGLVIVKAHGSYGRNYSRP